MDIKRISGDIYALLDYSITEISKIKELKSQTIWSNKDGEDKEFLLSDLFKGYEWNQIPIKNRRLLGSLFFDYICNAEINNFDYNTTIIATKKNSSNQQKYQCVFRENPPLAP